MLGNSHIIPIVIGETEKTEAIANTLQEKGFWVLPIRHPTVPKNEARLRFSITADHTEQMIGNVCEALESVL